MTGRTSLVNYRRERERERGSMGYEDSLPFFGMLMVILIQVGNMEVSQVAMSAGMNKYVLAVYSNALSTLILLPLSFICCRSFSLSSSHSIHVDTVFLPVFPFQHKRINSVEANFFLFFLVLMFFDFWWVAGHSVLGQ